MINSSEYWEGHCSRSLGHTISSDNPQRVAAWIVNHTLSSRGNDLLGRSFTACNNFEIRGSNSADVQVARVNFDIFFNKNIGVLEGIAGLDGQLREGIFPWHFLELFLGELEKKRVRIDSFI
ncbi:hypothetical protein M1403_03905 [Patescibacteria group bacterium]|nr:hypothetical protein [Patescibacteria group bacterium]